MNTADRDAATLRDKHYNKLAWRICPECGVNALVLVKAKGFCSRSCAMKGERAPSYGKTGAANPLWRGSEVGYAAKHVRVRKLRGSARHCSKCGATDPALRYEWANLTGNYDDPDDYAAMCVPCHRRFDIEHFKSGEQHYRARLTEAIVREARRRYEAGDGDTVSLASEFGVSQTTMYRAIKRETWKHVT